MVEFSKLHWIDGVYDLGVMMGLIPLVLCVQGRWGPYLMLLPVTLLPIAGKTLRALSTRPFSVTWLAYLIAYAARHDDRVWFAQQAKPEGEHPLFVRCALLFCVWIFHDLNFAFFDFPWPWKDWGGRHPNALIFLSPCWASPSWCFSTARKNAAGNGTPGPATRIDRAWPSAHHRGRENLPLHDPDNQVRIGLAKGDDALLDLTAAGVESITSILESTDPKQHLTNLSEQDLPEVARDDVLCFPRSRCRRSGPPG